MRPRLILSLSALSLAVALVGMWTGAAPTGSAEDAKENELRAVGCVRSLNTAASYYKEQHPDKGFPNSLADVGPSGDNLLDTSLSSAARNGYYFVYVPGRPDEQGRINAYTFLARPQVYGRTGKLNVFTDETAKVRVTSENRDANVQDPPL